MLREYLCKLFRCCERPHLSITLSYEGAQFHGVTKMILTNEQKVKLKLEALTAGGNPASFDGDPQWDSSNLGIGQFEPVEGDPNAVYFVAREVGQAQLSVEVDADLGDGFSVITGYLDVTVVEAGAAVVRIVAGEPEQQ